VLLIDCLLTHLILFAVFFLPFSVVKVLLDLKFSATERETERQRESLFFSLTIFLLFLFFRCADLWICLSAPQVSTLVYTPLLVDLGRCSTPGRVENHFLKKKERKKAIK
jgi:hypothetical protein